jgi:hypothetical protein
MTMQLLGTGFSHPAAECGSDSQRLESSTSDGQPENLVGRFRLSATNLNSQKATLTLALSRRERGTDRVVWESYADGKYRVEFIF